MMGKLIHLLLGGGTAPGGGATSVHFSLGISHPWLAALGLLAIAAVGIWSYRAQSVPPKLRWFMGALRGLVLLMVLLMFCRPMLVVSQTLRTRSVVAVWIDTSDSMSLRDRYPGGSPMQVLVQQVEMHSTAHGPTSTGRVVQQAGDFSRRPSRFALACWSLSGSPGQWLQRLVQRQEVAIFTGGSSPTLVGTARNVKELTDLETSLSQKQPVHRSTDVPGIVAGIFRQLQGRPVGGIILLTDGRSTPGGAIAPVQALARDNASPIFGVAIGRRHQPFNVQLQQVQAPRHAFVQDPVAIRAAVRLSGATQPLTVRLHLYRQNANGSRGAVLASKSVRLSPSQAVTPVQLVFHPDEPGHYQFMLGITPVPGQLTRRGDAASGISTDVVQAKIKVLYVDGYPRWEYRYLKNDLLREKTVQLSCLLLSADNAFAQEGNLPINRFPDTQKELDRYDVLLLGDVDPDYFSAKQQDLILHFVGHHGGGFGMIAGPYYAPNAYRSTPLAQLLPIVPDDASNPALQPPPNQPFELHLTDAGRNSTVFQFFSSEKANLQQVAHLPPLYWYQPVLGLQASAAVLADLPSRTINGRPMPLLVLGRYGAGRTMFSAIADTWRWRYYHDSPLYKSYWLEMVRLLDRSRAFGQASSMSMTVPSRHVEAGSPVTVSLKVRDPILQSQMPQQVRLNLVNAAGAVMQPVMLSRVGAGAGKYEGTVTLWRSGDYQIAAPAGELPKSVPAIHLTASLPNREFANPTADPQGLARLVAGTGGKLLPLPQASQLAHLVPDRSVETLLTQARQMWNKPIALLLVVLLLTVEWVLRKRSGLV